MNFGIGSEKTKIQFQSNGNGASCASKNGNVQVDIDTIGNIIKYKTVTFIKMDIEGMKLEALKGAEKTILNNKPQLAICMYHKEEDLFEIPMFLKSLLPEYKLYLRHYSNTLYSLVLHAVL